MIGTIAYAALGDERKGNNRSVTLETISCLSAAS